MTERMRRDRSPVSLCGIVRPAGRRRLRGWNDGQPGEYHSTWAELWRANSALDPEPRRGRRATRTPSGRNTRSGAVRTGWKVADAGHAAQQIDPVEQVDQRQPHCDRPAGRPGEDVRYAGLHLLVGWNGFAVEFEIVGWLGAQAGPGNQIDAKPGAAPQICSPGGFGFSWLWSVLTNMLSAEASCAGVKLNCAELMPLAN